MKRQDETIGRKVSIRGYDEKMRARGAVETSSLRQLRFTNASAGGSSHSFCYRIYAVMYIV